MKKWRTPNRPFSTTPAISVPLLFYAFGQHGGHFVAETCWKEMVVPLIVDSGSTHSMLHSGLFLAGVDGLKKQTAQGQGRNMLADQPHLMVVGGGGSIPCAEEPVQVSGMLLGPLELPPAAWNLLNLSAVRNRYREYAYPPPCGLLGMDMLRQLHATLDCNLQHPSLVFSEKPPHLPTLSTKTEKLWQ